jgi:hypothetical protein
LATAIKAAKVPTTLVEKIRVTVTIANGMEFGNKEREGEEEVRD